MSWFLNVIVALYISDEVESEGTLSDGGEFYSDMPGIYPPSPTIDRSRIPITSAALVGGF